MTFPDSVELHMLDVNAATTEDNENLNKLLEQHTYLTFGKYLIFLGGEDEMLVTFHPFFKDFLNTFLRGC